MSNGAYNGKNSTAVPQEYTIELPDDPAAMLLSI